MCRHTHAERHADLVIPHLVNTFLLPAKAQYKHYVIWRLMSSGMRHSTLLMNCAVVWEDSAAAIIMLLPAYTMSHPRRSTFTVTNVTTSHLKTYCFPISLANFKHTFSVWIFLYCRTHILVVKTTNNILVFLCQKSLIQP